MTASGTQAQATYRRCAVLVPCLDEEATVGDVVTAFRAALPGARVFVFDNGSRDLTSTVAAAAGATVVASPRRGKGNVIRHMLRTVDADVLLLVDGDGTYPAGAAPELLSVLRQEGADMVVGTRLGSQRRGAFRPLHRFGNHVLSGLIRTFFGSPVTDVLSGYRAFTAHAAAALRLQSEGFEIETEMTLQALVRDWTIREVPIDYGARPAGSRSKLNTFTDALRILRVMALIFVSYKPRPFFLGLAAVCFVGGLVAGWRPVLDYAQTRFVSHVPLALLAAGLEIVAAVLFGIALVLDAIVRLHFETLQALDSTRGRPPSSEAEPE